MRNPFTPTFGKVPPYMAGRQDILDAMSKAFEDGSGNPNLSSILIGPRGSGKTALLACIAAEALEHGWISARVSALPGMLEDISMGLPNVRVARFSQPMLRIDASPFSHMSELARCPLPTTRQLSGR